MGTAEDKAVERIRSIPADYTYSELVSLMKRFGFEERQGSGSRVKFIHPATKRKLILHKPHPGNIVKKSSLRGAVEWLQKEGLI